MMYHFIDAKFPDEADNRRGISLVEIMVAISIIALLVALILPAVNQAREAARRIECLNNLKEIALASLSLESTTRHLPGPRMNAHPNSNLYNFDMGLFVTMLPYLDESRLYSKFAANSPSNSLANQSILLLRPSILKCPSALESALLHSMSGEFSGRPIVGIDGISCDYVGNDGTSGSGYPLFGTVRLRVGTIVRERRLSEVSDGSSHTLLFWESIGDSLRTQRTAKVSADLNSPSNFTYHIDNSIANNLYSTTRASYKSYGFSWTGFRVGVVNPEEGAVMNVSNLVGEPYSAHPGLLPCCMTDGSVTCVNESIETNILVAMSTAQSGEVLNVE